MKQTETLTSRDGTRIAYDLYGSGDPVILVGGAFQQRMGDQQTVQLASLLGAGHTVYHYDRRGRGGSTDTLPYAVEREVEDLAALVDAAGGSACVFGMSSGAVLALRACEAGVPVRKLAVYEPPYQLSEQARARAGEYPTQLKALLAEGRRGDAAALAMVTFGAPPEMVEGMRTQPFFQAFEAVAPTLAYDSAVMEDGLALPDRFAGLQVPTLVIDGGASPEWMQSAAAELAGVLPNGRRVTLEGQTHNFDPGVLAPVLLEFYSEA